MAKVVCTVSSKVYDKGQNFVDDYPVYDSQLMHSDYDEEDLEEDENLISDEDEDNESGFLSQR